MKDKEYAKQKKRVEALIKAWSPALHPPSWTLTYNWYSAQSDMPADVQDAQMFCRSHWQYLTAVIGICCDGLQDKTDDQVEFMLVHEYMHCYAVVMRPKPRADKCEELACSLLAAAFIRHRDLTRSAK